MTDTSRCTTCRSQERLYSKGTCARCHLRHYLLGGEYENIPQLKPILDFLAQHPRPRQVIRWLQRMGGAKFLRSIAHREAELSHATMDAFPSEKRAAYMRSLLMSAGALEVRNVTAADLQRWAKKFLGKVHQDHRIFLTMFFEWRLLRRLRRKIERGQLTEGGRKWVQGRLRSANKFLCWLAKRGKRIDTCAQEDIDRWLVDMKCTTAYSIRDFIRWTVNRKLSPPLTVPPRKVRSSLATQEEELRWSMIEKLINDNNISLDLRLIGLFNLAFGQHLSRTLQLRNTSITLKEDHVTVNFGKEPVDMPPVIAYLLRKQLAASWKDPKAHRPDSTCWLFPGQSYGHHLTPTPIQKRLRAIGILTRTGRNTALLDLAAKVQPAILGRLLNISPWIAVNWGDLAGHNFYQYVASRKRGLEDNQSL